MCTERLTQSPGILPHARGSAVELENGHIKGGNKQISWLDERMFRTAVSYIFIAHAAFLYRSQSLHACLMLKVTGYATALMHTQQKCTSCSLVGSQGAADSLTHAIIHPKRMLHRDSAAQSYQVIWEQVHCQVHNRAAHLDDSVQVHQLGQVCIDHLPWAGALRGNEQLEGIQLLQDLGLHLRVL